MEPVTIIAICSALITVIGTLWGIFNINKKVDKDYVSDLETRLSKCEERWKDYGKREIDYQHEIKRLNEEKLYYLEYFFKVQAANPQITVHPPPIK